MFPFPDVVLNGCRYLTSDTKTPGRFLFHGFFPKENSQKNLFFQQSWSLTQRNFLDILGLVLLILGCFLGKVSFWMIFPLDSLTCYVVSTVNGPVWGLTYYQCPFYSLKPPAPASSNHPPSVDLWLRAGQHQPRTTSVKWSNCFHLCKM